MTHRPCFCGLSQLTNGSIQPTFPSLCGWDFCLVMKYLGQDFLRGSTFFFTTTSHRSNECLFFCPKESDAWQQAAGSSWTNVLPSYVQPKSERGAGAPFFTRAVLLRPSPCLAVLSSVVLTWTMSSHANAMHYTILPPFRLFDFSSGPRLFPLISGLSVEISENPAKRFAYFHRFSLMW